MKLNWTVRFKNPVFWMTIIPAFCTFIYAVLSCFDIVPGISEDVLTNALLAIVSALTNLGVLVDPTTAGMSDSKRAMDYTEPA